MSIPETLTWANMTEQQRAAVRMWFALGHTVELSNSEGAVSQFWVDERFKEIILENPNSVLGIWRFRLKPND